jgi:hypothetical protein
LQGLKYKKGDIKKGFSDARASFLLDCSTLIEDGGAGENNGIKGGLNFHFERSRGNNNSTFFMLSDFNARFNNLQ